MPEILLIPAPYVFGRKLRAHFPYGLLSLQAAAVRADREIDILALSSLDNQEMGDSDDFVDSIADLVDGDAYDVVGLSTSCGSFHHSLGIARALRQRHPRLQVWLGGPQASVVSQKVLNAVREIDAVFEGESEVSFVEALNTMSISTDAPSGIPGVRTRASRFVSRSILADLDDLPEISEAKQYLPVYLASKRGYQAGIPLEVERGCPGRCTFCSTRLYWGGRYRYKSPHRVVREMDQLHRLTGEVVFSFIGDNLSASPHALRDLCSCLAEKASSYRWACSLRVERLTKGDLDTLWEAGCRAILVGVESGSQETLDRIRKGVSLPTVVRMLHAAIDRGFLVQPSFIVGFPWERSEDIRDTYRLHLQLLERGARDGEVISLSPRDGTGLHRSYGCVLRPAGRCSTPLGEDLRLGPRASALIDEHPELFVPLGNYEASDLDPVELRAVVQAAMTATDHYRRMRGPAIIQ